MRLLRNPTVRRIFCLFTGVVFLNLSFFLSGISLLYPEDKQMVENVSKLVLNEEERDTHGTETQSDEKAFPWFYEHISDQHVGPCLLAGKLHPQTGDPSLSDGHSENFSPPPELQVGLA